MRPSLSSGPFLLFEPIHRTCNIIDVYTASPSRRYFSEWAFLILEPCWTRQSCVTRRCVEFSWRCGTPACRLVHVRYEQKVAVFCGLFISCWLGVTRLGFARFRLASLGLTHHWLALKRTMDPRIVHQG